MAWWKFLQRVLPRTRHARTTDPRQGQQSLFEPLEPRQFLSAPAFTLARASREVVPPIPQNINLSHMDDSQSEGAIAIDPSNPKRIFALSNLEWDTGLFSARSTDGGVTWSQRIIANGKDGIVAASCDPSVVFDEYGNLFIGYIDSRQQSAEVAMSRDGGQTFTKLGHFRGDLDQPTVTAAKGMVYITFEQNNRIMVAGARVGGLGVAGKFSTPRAVPGSTAGNFGDIAIGPKGQVMVAWLAPIDDNKTADVYVSVDLDGLGKAGFQKPVLAASTSMLGFEAIPAQARGTIDAEPALAFDRSGGIANGRVYLLYTSMNRKARGRADTNIALRYSNDNGRTWSVPRRINDDAGYNSQFLPRLAVDQTTGHLGMSWHDCRMDNGAVNSTDAIPNDDAQLWAAVATPTATGLILSPNFQVSAGTSNANRSRNEIDYGDYTGLAFQAGVVMPIWADNSNSSGDNPAGRLHSLDIYTAKVSDPMTA